MNHFSFRVSIFQITGELIFLDQMIAKIMHNSQIFDNRIRLITTTVVIWANFISIKLFQHVKTIRDFPCQFWWWIRKMLWSRVNVRLIKLALLFKGVYAALRLTASSTHCRLVEVIKSVSMCPYPVMLEKHHLNRSISSMICQIIYWGVCPTQNLKLIL